MKKIICLALMMLLCLGLFTVVAGAAPASGYLSGPDAVKAGDTITLTFGVSGTNIFGVDCTLSYDSSQLTLVSTSAAIGGSWVAESNGDQVLVYDNDQTNLINGSSDVFNATFQVDPSLAVGTRISVECNGMASDGNADMDIFGSYSTVLVKEQVDLSLKNLTVSNGIMSPKFSPAVTDYTARISHSESKAKISATAADSNASVSVSDTSVAEGESKRVVITVSSPDGETKEYTITVTREKAPEESEESSEESSKPEESKKPDDGKKPEESSKPSEDESSKPEDSSESSSEESSEESKPSKDEDDGKDDKEDEAPSADLKDLKVIDGELSPAFSSNITEYTVLTDGEIDIEDIIAETADPDATVKVVEEEAEGSEQRFKVTVTAADGKEKSYTITATATEEDVPAMTVPVKCGFNCPCMWLWIVTMVLLAAVTVTMFVLYKKLRNEKK
ncbi:MAG: cadherin-like beta sandwich domain-containing protein [Oscillospiraceae bacterium]|nr:cadherin-like beta sandwich domain-containing protein [Oscillospiraceae bacterium]